MSRTALYRHFDAAGRLLYVGVSLNAINRLSQHRDNAHWFNDIARVTIKWLPTRSSALAAEAVAIATERPMHNIAGNCAPARELVAWGVFHPASKRFDGWYFHRDDAIGVLEYFRDEFPAERFHLVGRTKQQEPFTGRVPLRSMNSEQWARAAAVLAPARAFAEGA